MTKTKQKIEGATVATPADEVKKLSDEMGRTGKVDPAISDRFEELFRKSWDEIEAQLKIEDVGALSAIFFEQVIMTEVWFATSRTYRLAMEKRIADLEREMSKLRAQVTKPNKQRGGARR